MVNIKSRPADDDGDPSNFARMLYSVGKGVNADDGVARPGIDCGASTSVGDATYVAEVPQSRELTGEDNVRDLVLEPKHKIFLSHSGAQKSFVADLCSELMRRDRHPFFDKLRSSLPVGQKFPDLIFDAIKQCQVGVLLLSEEFLTRGKWPMLELAAMVEENKTRKPNQKIKIIPAYYSISRERCLNPDVHGDGEVDLTMNWRKWEEEDPERIDVENWKKALKECCGPHMGLIKGDGELDGRFRARIVEAVCKIVRPETRWDDSRVEGKTRLFKEISERIFKGARPMDLKGGVHVVGLYGTGGVGKTTACKVLCNELSGEYHDKVCHVEFGSARDEELLQKVLRKLSDLEVERLEKLKVDECHNYLKTHPPKGRVFLALDNVSDESDKQAKSLLRAKFEDGSVVLVTARSMDQLNRLGVKKENCFGMPELELEEAKSLFLNSADLKQNEVGEGFVMTCLNRCYFFMSSDREHYHLLALKVLGNEVGDMIRGGKDESAVLSRISDFNLSRREEHPVFSILRSSYDSVLEKDKLLFLDIALKMGVDDSHHLDRTFRLIDWLCMVHGKDRDEVEPMLECLKRRSLLDSFDEDKDGDLRFHMHDLWREFAKEEMKVKEFRKFSKVEMKGGEFRALRWVYEGEKCGRMVDLKEYTMLEAVKLRYNGEDVVAVDVRGLKHLKSLEIMVSGGVAKEVIGLGTLEGLGYLVVWNAASAECVAELGLLTNLQYADLSCFRGDSLPHMSMMTSLKVLGLRESRLKCINLQNLPRLSHMYLKGCYALWSVDISGCRSMKEFSFSTWDVVLRDYYDVFVDGLHGLREANLSFCPLISSLTGLEYMITLRKLNITGCSSIEELDDLSSLENLEELRARDCERLAVFPACELPKLRVLDIESSKVPDGPLKQIFFPMLDLEHDKAKVSFLNHADLKETDIGEEFVKACLRRCSVPTGQSSSSDGKQYHRLALKVLGSEVGHMIRGGKDGSAVLSRINDVNLSREGENPIFSILRISFDSMLEAEQLLFLDLALDMVFVSPIEEWVCVVNGKDHDEVVNMMEHLRRKSLVESFRADEKRNRPCHIHDLWREFAKEEMKVWKFGDRRWVYEGEEYRERVDLTEYPKLEAVKLKYYGEGFGPVDVGGLKHLKSLQIDICSRAVTRVVSGLGTLETLTYLALDAASYECIAELGLLTNLRAVNLHGFRGDRLPDMSKLTYLNNMDLSESRSLESINLQNLPRLMQLSINGCHALRSVDLSGCRSLSSVIFCKVGSVVALPNRPLGLDCLVELEELNLSFCPLIQSLEGLKDLPNLRKLNITGCSTITKFNLLECFEKLEELRATACEGLAMLPVCTLPNLRVLDIESQKVPIGFGTLDGHLENWPMHCIHFAKCQVDFH